MKRTAIILLLALLIVPLTTAFAGGNGNGNGNGKGRNGGGAGGNKTCNEAALLLDLTLENLGPKEAKGLLYMREEEKLARDVYLSLYETWGARVFRQISKAESKHMASTLLLIDKYEEEDPVGDNAVGIFTNTHLQQLYKDLVATGNGSLESAYLVGAAIEDLDIFDLQVRLEQTNNEDIQVLYQNLMKGSRNHLRAFSKVLARQGITYEPVYISAMEYEEIITTRNERGLLDANGDLLCGGGKGGRGKK